MESFRHSSYRYGTGTLTEVFLDRVFQECLTYEGEMVSARKVEPLANEKCSQRFFRSWKLPVGVVTAYLQM